MPLGQTHTLVLAYISPSSFDEIKKKLDDAGYGHAVLNDERETVLDMTGIGLCRAPESTNASGG
jgi:hypothetical protein